MVTEFWPRQFLKLSYLTQVHNWPQPFVPWPGCCKWCCKCCTFVSVFVSARSHYLYILKTVFIFSYILKIQYKEFSCTFQAHVTSSFCPCYDIMQHTLLSTSHKSDKLVRTCITPFELLGTLNRVEKMMKQNNRWIGASLIRAEAD